MVHMYYKEFLSTRPQFPVQFLTYFTKFLNTPLRHVWRHQNFKKIPIHHFEISAIIENAQGV